MEKFSVEVGLNGTKYVFNEKGEIIDIILAKHSDTTTPGVTTGKIKPVNLVNPVPARSDKITEKIFDLVWGEKGGLDEQSITGTLNKDGYSGCRNKGKSDYTVKKRLSSLIAIGLFEKTEDSHGFVIDRTTIYNKRKGLRTLGTTKISSKILDEPTEITNAVASYLRKRGFDDSIPNRRVLYAIAKHLVKQKIV